MPDDSLPSEPSPPLPPEGVRRPRGRVMLAFLAVFALLIVVFRHVLFPFLMAIYVAYLVEPLVRRATRSRLLGIKWTRGPTILVLYVVVLGGFAVLGWVGIATLATTVQSTARDVAKNLEDDGQRATFHLSAPTTPPASEETGDEAPEPQPERAVMVPKGTILAMDSYLYKTLYRVRLDPEQREVSVLLEDAQEDAPEHPAPKADAPARLVAPGTLHYVGAKKDERGIDPVDLERLRIQPGGTASGLEYFAEREFISPIVHNLEGAGFTVEPTLVRDFVHIKGEVLKADLPERVGKGAVAFAGKLVLSIYQFFLILMLTAFIVMDRKGIASFAASLPPPNYKPAYHRLMRYIDDGLAGVIRGQLVICGVNGLLTYVGLLSLGVPYSAFLAVVATIFSLIPVFGTIISSIPIVIIGLTDGVDTGIYALLWILFIHLIEANMLNPLIMGTHARMHPVVIIFALLAGEHAFGIWGALLAVPTASIIQSCFRYYLHEIEGLPQPPEASRGESFKQLWEKWRARAAKGKPSTEAADA